MIDADTRTYVIPQPCDILCGRGAMAFNNPGNKYLRSCIATKLTIYLSCGSRKREKTSIIRAIINDITVDKGGRFLKYDRGEKRWYDGGIEVGKQRVGIAFRDAATPQKVKCMEKMMKEQRHTRQEERQASLVRSSPRCASIVAVPEEEPSGDDSILPSTLPQCLYQIRELRPFSSPDDLNSVEDLLEEWSENVGDDLKEALSEEDIKDIFNTPPQTKELELLSSFFITASPPPSLDMIHVTPPELVSDEGYDDDTLPEPWFAFVGEQARAVLDEEGEAEQEKLLDEFLRTEEAISRLHKEQEGQPLSSTTRRVSNDFWSLTMNAGDIIESILGHDEKGVCFLPTGDNDLFLEAL